MQVNISYTLIRAHLTYARKTIFKLANGSSTWTKSLNTFLTPPDFLSLTMWL